MKREPPKEKKIESQNHSKNLAECSHWRQWRELHFNDGVEDNGVGPKFAGQSRAAWCGTINYPRL
jgi:hypothetical protein